MNKYLSLFLFLIIVHSCYAPLPESNEPNYDESNVPEYELPEILKSWNGQSIISVEQWEGERRAEIWNLFKKEMFGEFPDDHISVRFEVKKNEVINGTARLKEIDMIFHNNTDSVVASLLIFIPLSELQTPLFLGMNFYGNHTIHPDPRISISESWTGNNSSFHIFNHKANELSRGVRTNRWPVEYIIGQGYGLATIYYGDIDPDYDDGFENGIHALLEEENKDGLSSISAWSWSLSKALDYFEEDEHVDEERVVVFGHSRLGKTSLWAGVSDPRFAMVISNNSGCGGAALSKRAFGETIKAINDRFPHWFVSDFKKYNGRESDLTFDQHMLMSLVAPRPLYVASATQDTWADPTGEFLSVAYAGKVYDLYGYEFIKPNERVDVDKPVWKGRTAYHLREGTHDITRYDWVQYISFANKFLK